MKCLNCNVIFKSRYYLGFFKIRKVDVCPECGISQKSLKIRQRRI